MNFRNKILILAAIGAWLVPFFANVSVPVSRSAAIEAPLGLAASPGPQINVTTATTATALTVAPSAVLTACSPASDQAALFNLPANCFDLTIGRLVAQPSVQVIQFYSDATVKIAVQAQASFLTGALVPGHANPVLPSLPLPAVGLLGIALLVWTAVRSQGAKRLSSQYRIVLSLSQLGVMRC